MKKVLFVATVTKHINTFHIPYLKWFKEQGYEVHVASNGNEKIEYCDKHFNLPFERFPIKKNNFKVYKELKNIIKENEYEIIHCHTPVGGVLTRLAAKTSRKKGTRVIYTAHGFHFYKGAPLLNWIIYYPIEKWLSKYTDCLITINQEDYELAKRKFKKCKEIELIHGVGLDTSKFDIEITEKEFENLKNEIEIESDNIILTYVAELNKNKNQILLIKVLEELVKENNKYRLLLVGNGPMREKLEQYVKENNLQKYVKLLGRRDDISKILKLTNVYVASSLREGLPINLLEAMYMNLPIVATDNRGHRELIQNGVNGYICDKLDIKTFKMNIKKIFENMEKIDSMKEKNNTLIKKYELKEVKQKMEEIYKDMEENIDMSNNPVRILQVIRQMNVGGAETFLMNTYRNIDREKVQFDFLVNDKGFFDEEIKKLGGKIYYMNYITRIGQIKYKKKLKKFLKEHPEYTIMHSHIDQVSGIILEAAKEAGVPNRIAHSHSTKNTNNLIGKLYKRYLQSKINKSATVLLACGEEAAKWLYKSQWKRAIIVKNGIDIERFKFSEEKRKEIRKKLDIDDKIMIIGHVGRFSRVKNQEFLVKIYKEYEINNPNSLLIMVGEGEEKEKLENLVSQENLKSKIKFLGLRQDTDSIYSAMDYMIFPSLYEGISIALIEAQASGLKILASDTIDKNTDISGNIEWISLKELPSEWCKHIINTRERKIDEKKLEEYDIKRTARKLQEIYIKLGE